MANGLASQNESFTRTGWGDEKPEVACDLLFQLGPLCLQSIGGLYSTVATIHSFRQKPTIVLTIQ